MIKRVAVGVMVLIAMFAFSGTIQTGIHNWRTETIPQDAIVITVNPDTTTDVILTDPLFGGKLSEVLSIESTIDEDPVATDYDADTDTLTVGALDTDETRTLTITYYTEVTDQLMPVLGPFLSFLIFGGIIGAVIYSIWSGRKN